MNIFLGFFSLDNATYGCPCENSGLWIYNPKFSKSCPCYLLIVIANAKRIGNCFLYNVNWKDKFFSVFDVIRGINTVEPIFSPVKITAFILYSYKLFMFNLVPLHSAPLKFLNNITWACILF